MTDHELANSLLQAGAAEGPAAQAGRHLAAQVLDRDRRRIRLLGAATLLLWLLGAAGIAFVLYELSVYVPQYLDFRYEKAGARSLEKRQSFQEGYFAGFQVGMVVVTASVAVLALASLGTFLLVLATRRATLRQINASLVLISQRLERLQELREHPPGGPAALSGSHAGPRRET
jgi:hypothetical protein